MSLDGYLLKVTRIGEHSWKSEQVLEILFPRLVVPEIRSFNLVKFRKSYLLYMLNAVFLIFVTFQLLLKY